MPFELDVRHENLSYVGKFAYPPFELWGSVLKGVFDALSPYGVTLQNLQVTPSLPNAAEPIVTAVFQNVGALKFSLERIECNFANFTAEFFESIPALLSAAVGWMTKATPSLRFSSHRFSYFTHAFVKDSTPADVLRTLSPRELKSTGISLGNGVIFHSSVPQMGWETQLIVDKSQFLTGGLFVNLIVSIGAGEVEYAKLMGEGRTYLREALAELDLRIPEAETAK